MQAFRQFNFRNRCRAGARRPGAMMIYTLIGMTALCGVASLAVDFGRVQLVKTELQRASDSIARMCAVSMTNAVTDANTRAYATLLGSMMTADARAITVQSGDVEFGTWTAATKTFVVKPSSVGANAIRITTYRTAARSTSVPLLWGKVIGRNSMDVSVAAIACYSPAQVKTVTINPAQADPWLAGMSAGATASYDDTAPANNPPELGLDLAPGSYITFTSASGTVSNAPSAAYVPPDGNSGQILSHGADSPGGATPAAENGVADAVMPINAILGLFVNENAPNTTSAPATRLDYSTAASRDQVTYDDIGLKQPFFIGDGRTTSGTTQQFKVPDGATRLFLGTMDGHQWNNNLGSFTITVTVPASISLVK